MPWPRLEKPLVTLALAALAAASPAPAAEGYVACTARIAEDPQAALAAAESWAEETRDPAADHCRALALVALARYAEAASALETLGARLAEAEPFVRAAILAQGGRAWLAAGESARAIAAFDAALALDPENADVLVDRAEAHAAGGNYWDAIGDLDAAARLAPGNPIVHALRASAYRHVDLAELALEEAEEAVRLDPREPLALLARANARAELGDRVGARTDWQAVIELAPRSAAAAIARDALAGTAE